MENELYHYGRKGMKWYQNIFTKGKQAAAARKKRKAEKEKLSEEKKKAEAEEFKSKVKNGGFYLCPWDGTEETEAQIKADTQATIRCVPYGYDQSDLGVDMVSGKPAVARVVVARSY